jgi:hypothetical protein
VAGAMSFKHVHVLGPIARPQAGVMTLTCALPADGNKILKEYKDK